MYGVGLRVGPVVHQQPEGRRPQVHLPRRVLLVLGLLGAVLFTKMFGLPRRRGGRHPRRRDDHVGGDRLGGEAVKQGVFKLAEGQTAEQVTGMIALAYGVTYIWGTVGIILICKYLPRWWGIDAKAAAKKYEEENGVPNVDDAGLTGYRPLGAARLPADEQRGRRPDDPPVPAAASAVQDRQRRARRRALGAADDLVLQKGDVIALGGRLEAMTAEHGPDRPRGAGREGAQHPARPGRDPGHQQGDGGQGAEGVAQTPTSPARWRCTASSAAACRSRWASTPSSSASTCCSWRPQVRDRQGGGAAGQDRAPEHLHRPADARRSA